MENDKLVRLSDMRLIESRPDAYPEEWNDSYEKGFVDAINAVLDIPAVDAVEVRHGTWIKTVVAMSRLYDEKGMTENMNGYTCGACKEFSTAKFNFCPNCGARMDGEDGDGDG